MEKAGPYDPKHPGWPKGETNRRGGKFRPKTPDDTPGVGHNNGPPMDEPDAGSLIGRRTLAQAIKTGIRRLVAAGIVAADISAPEVTIPATILAEIAAEAYPDLNAYLDGPKSLEELQAAAQSPSKAGYDDHHIVEQATANPDGSEDALMDAPDNLARIPTVKHWELNRSYEAPSFEFDYLTPREYLKGKSWEERRRVGLIGLRYVGVLQ